MGSFVPHHTVSLEVNFVADDDTLDETVAKLRKLVEDFVAEHHTTSSLHMYTGGVQITVTKENL